jgi:hypothetical protein
VATIAAVLFTAALFLRPGARRFQARSESERPELLLLPSLPIVFPDRFTLDGKAPAVLGELQGRYRVLPISIAEASSLSGHRLLLMAQPRAQPAEVLVELDAWVRRGGRLLLLADPALQWPGDRPLGDPLNPPFAFADTGLLDHWGLRLEAPERLEERRVQASGRTIRTASPGVLVATGGNCRVEKPSLVARCAIGRGTAIVIADSDFLDTDRFGTGNIQLLFAGLAELEE